MRIVKFFEEYILPNKKNSFLIIYGLYLFSHIFFLFQPPKGAHIWRQCNTSTTARNFVEEEMNIFKPRVDKRYDTDGVTGMQFPSFEYTVALVSKLTGGYHESWNRIIAFIFFGLGIFFFYELVGVIFNDRKTQFFAAWFFTWSPVLYYHSINALPDILALTASIGGLLYFLKWNIKRDHANIVFATFWTTLAGLTKLQYLAIGVPILIIFIQHFKTYRIRDIVNVLLYGLISCCVSLLWYKYAIGLIESSGLNDFGLELRPVDSIEKAIEILGKNLGKHFPELIIGFTGLLGFVIGVYRVFGKKQVKNMYFWPFVIWTVVLLAYHLIELSQMSAHVYYMFPYFMIVFMLVAYGFSYLWEKRKVIVLLCVFLSPINAYLRIFHLWHHSNRDLPTAFFNKEERRNIEKLIPDDELVIVGPDESGCVFHYFTHTKGFTFRDVAHLKSKSASISNINRWKNLGASYLITNEKIVEENRVYLDGLGYMLALEGDIIIYKLSK